MKSIRIFWLFISMIGSLPGLAGQGIDIGTGASIVTTGPGDAHIILQNANWINAWNTPLDHCVVRFTGTQNSVIGGSQFSYFDKLIIDKQGASVLLTQDQEVVDSLVMMAGFLDLNGQEIEIYPDAALYNESETSRVIGPAGGVVQYGVGFYDPSINPNPGNLGLSIQGPAVNSFLALDRSHVPALIGTIPSIDRVYEINLGGAPAFGYTFNYFDAELGSANEGALEFYTQEPNSNWESAGFFSRDPVTNEVVQSLTFSKAKITLADPTNIVLPVELINQSVTCLGNAVHLQWETATERNNQGFEVQASTNAEDWESIAWIDGLGSHHSGNRYEFVENFPGEWIYFRIVQTDFDGQQFGFPVMVQRCNASTSLENVLFPNPTTGLVHVQSKTAIEGFEIIDALGRTVWQYHQASNFNQLTVEVPATMVAGAYWLRLMDTERTVLPFQLIRP
ncbi:MAG: T9SS type A sorting domain-containing protein [Bacteroidota bacterium]